MHPLLKPRWIFLTLTLPQLVLAFLYYSSFRVIHTLLDEVSLSYWRVYTIALGCMWVVFTAYALYVSLKKQYVHWIAAGAMLLGYLAFYVHYVFHMEDMISWEVPQWMQLDGDLQLYALTFLMPVLMYSLIALVVWLTPPHRRKRAWIDFVIAVGIPLVWYIGITMLSALRAHWYSHQMLEHFFVIAFSAGTVLFLFFLIRGIFIMITNNSKGFRKYQLVWKIPIALLFPLAGLALNNGWLIPHELREINGFFGDFNNIWFVILAVVNGIAICLPDFKDPQLRFLTFILRCLTYPFTVYFFLVFLPWLPVSVLAIIVFGAGFLMLSPLVLMLVQTQEIANDRKFLKAAFPRSRLWLAMLICFLVIPSIIIVTYIDHRRNLHNALDYLYAPRLDGEAPSIDTEVIAKTLHVIRSNKDRSGRNFLLSGHDTPFLSSLYRWIVLDNLTLSAKKMELMEKTFTGSFNGYEENSWMWDWRTLPAFEPLVKIDTIKTVTKYDEKEQAWRTQVDLAITNHAENGFQEYSTELKLPDGCWISDYYLVVEGKKKKGLLVEKQAAMWVYQQIVSTNRDPGILYYNGANHVTFKVFPFAKGETRHTGIEFLHKEPNVLQIDSFSVALGDSARQMKQPVKVDLNVAQALYIPAAVKATLPKLNRKPYYHFVFDASSEEQRDELMQRIDKFLERKLISNEKGEISFTNYKVTTVPLSERANAIKSVKNEGGFLAELAIRKELYEHYKRNDNTYPVFILVTDNTERALFTGDVRNLLFTYPESESFYYLHSPDTLLSALFFFPRTLSIAAVKELPSSNVLHYNAEGISAWLPDNGEGSFVVPVIDKLDAAELNGSSWGNAAKMQALVQHDALHPEQAEDHWLEIVKNSFRTSIMTPFTSYIVVENEAQEKAMLDKQKQTLSAKRGLDASEDTFRMSEPSLWIMLIAAASGIWLMRRRKREALSKSR